MIEDKDYQPRNRHKARQIKGGKFYCGCDLSYGGEWGKCPICGAVKHDKIRYDRKRSSFNVDT